MSGIAHLSARCISEMRGVYTKFSEFRFRILSAVGDVMSPKYVDDSAANQDDPRHRRSEALHMLALSNAAARALMTRRRRRQRRQRRWRRRR